MTDPSQIAGSPASVTVTVNGGVRAVPAGCSVAELVRLLGFSGAPVAVERNGEVVPRRSHEAVSLCEGDVLEVVTFVGGG
ncbi:MAG: sulfur carrier protein ThiS [Polyangia bacterium]